MLRKFKKGDLAKIKLQKEQMHEDTHNWNLFDNKDTLVFDDKERVLAIVLPVFEDGNKVSLYSLIGADCKDKAILMFKKMKRIIDDWLEYDGIERVEMTTQADFRQANRLAKLLGFECEGTMKKYFNGMDFNMWGRIK